MILASQMSCIAWIFKICEPLLEKHNKSNVKMLVFIPPHYRIYLYLTATTLYFSTRPIYEPPFTTTYSRPVSPFPYSSLSPTQSPQDLNGLTHTIQNSIHNWPLIFIPVLWTMSSVFELVSAAANFPSEYGLVVFFRHPICLLDPEQRGHICLVFSPCYWRDIFISHGIESHWGHLY